MKVTTRKGQNGVDRLKSGDTKSPQWLSRMRLGKLEVRSSKFESKFGWERSQLESLGRLVLSRTE